MKHKLLILLTAASFSLFFGACGDDSSSSGPDISCVEDDCLDNDDGDEDGDKELSSSSNKKPGSSSSKKEEGKSSSSEEVESSSSTDKNVSSSSKDEEKPSSSDSKDESSSSAKPESSSSEEPAESSSSEESESSSSEEPAKPVEYANTTPNLADLEVSGDTLFAIFQRQNADYSIKHNGLLALYNLSDGTLLDTITLATKNPSAVKVVKGNVYVATAGEYDASYTLAADENRGIEKVDLAKKKSSLFVAGTKLGGGVNDFVVSTKKNKGYALSYYAYGVTPLIKEIDLSTGAVKTIGQDILKDPEGGLDFDEENGILYIGERFIDWNTFEMHINVYAYDGTKLSEVSDAAADEEFRMPYSIKTIDGIPYVFVSDYSAGALYVDYADSESDGVSFYQDSKLAAVNGELFVMSRDNANATIAKINKTSGEAVWQATASGKNPYDMVAASASTAWIAYYDTPTLELINTADGSNRAIIETDKFCAVKVD